MHWTGSRQWHEKKLKINFYQEDTVITDVHLKQTCKCFSDIMCQNFNQLVNVSDGVCQMTLVESTCHRVDKQSFSSSEPHLDQRVHRTNFLCVPTCLSQPQHHRSLPECLFITTLFSFWNNNSPALMYWFFQKGIHEEDISSTQSLLTGVRWWIRT